MTTQHDKAKRHGLVLALALGLMSRYVTDLDAGHIGRRGHMAMPLVVGIDEYDVDCDIATGPSLGTRCYYFWFFGYAVKLP